MRPAKWSASRQLENGAEAATRTPSKIPIPHLHSTEGRTPRA
jgi:hypothetical protein